MSELALTPLVSILIVNWNTADLLVECLTSVRDNTALPHEVIVVDNGSTDGSSELVSRSFPEVQLVALTENVGYARGNNVALARARGRYLLLLNPDARLLPGSVASLVEFLGSHPAAGIAGPPLWHADGRPQQSVTLFPTLWTEFLRQTMLYRVLPSRLRTVATSRATRRVEALTGAAMCVARECFDAIGPLDSSIFMFYEDTDWCRRAHDAGYEVWFVEGPGVRHVKAAASGRHARARTLIASQWSSVYYFEKHHGRSTRAPLRIIAALAAVLRGARASAQWIAGRDRLDQVERIRAYRAILRWALVGGELPR